MADLGDRAPVVISLFVAAAVSACTFIKPTRYAPVPRRADGIGTCVDIAMTQEEAAYIDRLRASEPRENRISTSKENCDHWIEAHRATPESMPAARAYIDKARFDRCQDAMHGELAGYKAASREADVQWKRDNVGKEELEAGCSARRGEDLELWAAKLRGTMPTKLHYRKCWTQAGLKMCDRKAGFDVYAFEPKRKAVGIARPADAAGSAPFTVELDAPAPDKELHVFAYGYTQPSIRVDGAVADGPSPFEDQAARSESADGSFTETAENYSPPHVTSQVIRSGKPTVTVDGLGCALVVVFEGSAVRPTTGKDDSW